MSFDASRMGRAMDESVCNSARRADSGHHRASMVPCPTLPNRMEQPQHKVYCVRCGYSSAEFAVAAVGSQNTKRLQNVPAGYQTDDVLRNAVLHMHRTGIGVRGNQCPASNAGKTNEELLETIKGSGKAAFDCYCALRRAVDCD